MVQYVENKLIHYNLNLDYPLDFLSVEDQTNLLLNKVINNFVIKYQEDFGKKSFVYEFNDDLPSMVGYRILQAIAAIKAEFTFRLYGKAKRTKKMVAKGQKFCSKRELKKGNNIIFISSFNSIYKVGNVARPSINFITPNCYLIEQFTPQELFTAQVFYHIGYIKDGFESDDHNICRLTEWGFRPVSALPKMDTVSLRGGPPAISMIWLEDNENDLSLLQDIEQSDNIAFYFYSEDNVPKILLDNTFKLLLKRTTNRPTPYFMNINKYEHAAILSIFYKIKMEFMGNWPEEQKKQVDACIEQAYSLRTASVLEGLERGVN